MKDGERSFRFRYSKRILQLINQPNNTIIRITSPHHTIQDELSLQRVIQQIELYHRPTKTSPLCMILFVCRSPCDPDIVRRSITQATVEQFYWKRQHRPDMITSNIGLYIPTQTIDDLFIDDEKEE